MLQGGPIAYVDRRWIEGDAVPKRPFTVGPYHLYPLGCDFARDAVIAAVINGPFWWLPALRYVAQSIGMRVLATTYVWGLADCPVNEEPTWRSVHVLRWIGRLLGRL